VTVPVINSNSSLVCGRVVSRTSVARAENVLSLQITPNVVVGASDCAALDVEPLVVSTSVPPFLLLSRRRTRRDSANSITLLFAESPPTALAA
jgi:hypothetical protein